jgi:hypothetical protein
MWALWDFVTLRMIPPSMLHQKPIDLRHICLFYLGHIPAFLDIHLSRLLEEPNTEPLEYAVRLIQGNWVKFLTVTHSKSSRLVLFLLFGSIYSSGTNTQYSEALIPTLTIRRKLMYVQFLLSLLFERLACLQPHSDVPTDLEDWPSLANVVDYQQRVRARVMSLYDDIDSGKRTLTRKMGRVLFMTLEHEGMHAETLLYMLLQRAGSGTIAPPDFCKPDWTSLAAAWDTAPKLAHETVILGPATVTLGHDDDEEEDVRQDKVRIPDDHEYGWDNEHPKRTVEVQEFEISWRPVTNGEFYEFYLGHGKDKVELPASWVLEDGVVQASHIVRIFSCCRSLKYCLFRSVHSMIQSR